MPGEKHPVKHNKSTEVEVWQEPYNTEKIRRNMGRKALAFDGFTPLGEVESPFSFIQDELEARVIGQPDAIKATIEALERTEMRMPEDKNPIGVFVFLGPSGVGKTELAKSIASVLSGGNLNLIKIDGSAFSHGHEVSSLIGSPNGFRDSGAPVTFSKENIEKPGTVILVDEVEKGSPELFNLFLGIMDDGEIQTNTYTEDPKTKKQTKNPPTSFRDAIIVFTSNEGSVDMARLAQQHGTGFTVERKEGPKKEELEEVAVRSFKKFFRPEFINRIHKMIVFHSLKTEHLHDILSVKLDNLNIEYQRQLGVNVTLSPGARDFLVEIASNEPEYGARPLVRALEDRIQTPVGRYLGADAVGEGTQMRVFHASEAPESYIHTSNNELIFTMKRDAKLKKEVTILRELQSNKQETKNRPENIPEFTDNTVIFQAPVNPEDVYEKYYHPDDEADHYEEYADDNMTEMDMVKLPPLDIPTDDTAWRRPQQGTFDELFEEKNKAPDDDSGDDDDEKDD